jgi:hypothetical protein
MGVPTLVRRERKNATLSFIPAAEVVDSVTTTKTTWPDGDPTTNYTNYSIPDIEELTEEILSVMEPFRVPRTSGGYRLENEKHLEGLAFEALTAKTNSFLKGLQWATPAVVVAAAAQAPNERGQLWIDGVLLIELRSNAGVIIDRAQMWCRMFLVDPGAAAKAETSKLRIRWEVLDSGNNTYLAVA